ncbi:hypothetical protein ABW19_dt0207507 [Dactylella cylindrospora]|nr:hypothetical protein ABW19_dt0207507 [Dactylella cylindrospora]
MLSRIPRILLTKRSPALRPPLTKPLVHPQKSIRIPHGFPRQYSTRRPVDEKVDDLADLYVAAKDEFEIAVEETSKNTIYAREDRETAKEEFEKFKSAYEEAISSSSQEDGEEIKRRVGQRLRELDNAVENLMQADLQES